MSRKHDFDDAGGAGDPKPAAPVEYPTWRYHPTEPPRLINGPDEEPGQGWSDAPPPKAPAS